MNYTLQGMTVGEIISMIFKSFAKSLNGENFRTKSYEMFVTTNSRMA